MVSSIKTLFRSVFTVNRDSSTNVNIDTNSTNSPSPTPTSPQPGNDMDTHDGIETNSTTRPLPVPTSPLPGNEIDAYHDKGKLDLKKSNCEKDDTDISTDTVSSSTDTAESTKDRIAREGEKDRKRPRESTTKEGSTNRDVSHEGNSTRIVLSRGLEGVEAKEEMRVEILDSDYIWSTVKIIEVIKDDDVDVKVKVRYDGWGSEWDEVVSWRDNKRLAKLFTYTKQVKCLADFIPNQRKKGNKKSSLHLWPCTVNFRMPHPDGTSHQTNAEEMLRLERKVFVKPYEMKLLPSGMDMTFKSDGCWLHSSKVRRWKSRISFEKMGILPENFDKAYETGLVDETVKGSLSLAVIETGTLLNDKFRVMTLDGEENFFGDFSFVVNALRKLEEEKKIIEETKLTKYKTLKHDIVELERDPCDIENSVMEQSESNSHPIVVPPPKLPKGIKIRNELYPGYDVHRFERSSQWGAKVHMSGNAIILGPFPTQTQVFNAKDKALNSLQGIKKKKSIRNGLVNTLDANDEFAAQIKDIEVVSLYDIVAAGKKKQKRKDSEFSIHEWRKQQLIYNEFLMKNHNPTKKQSSEKSCKTKRKQKKPRKVDFKTNLYL